MPMKSTDMHTTHIPPLEWTDADAQKVVRNHQDSAARAAVQLWEAACEIDTGLTTDIVSAAEEAEMACIGLTKRVQSPAEMRETLLSYQDERASVHGEYRAPAATVIGDRGGPFRFTVLVTTHDRLLHSAVRFVRALQSREWEIDAIVHSYRRGSLRKAFAITATAPNGGRTNIRLHSNDSIAAEELAAEDWKTYTDSVKGARERQAAKGQCQESAALVPAPDGLDRITAIGGVPVSIKLYT